MTEQMDTYQKIKEVLDASMAILTTNIETNREIMNVKLAELKKDTEEIKCHAKETNGRVAENLDRIHVLEVEQNADTRFRKRSWWVVGTIVTLLIVEVISKFVL